MRIRCSSVISDASGDHKRQITELFEQSEVSARFSEIDLSKLINISEAHGLLTKR